jgi:hypothetical protein
MHPALSQKRQLSDSDIPPKILYQNDLIMRNTADLTRGEPIAFIVFYIYGRKIEVLLLCPRHQMGHDIIDITIDLVLIDPQSVGKRTHDMMDPVNAKKRWKTICWRVNKYLK